MNTGSKAILFYEKIKDSYRNNFTARFIRRARDFSVRPIRRKERRLRVFTDGILPARYAGRKI